MSNLTKLCAKSLLRRRRRENKRNRILSIFAAMVCVITVYILILPAITVEHQTICGKEEHEHTKDCYDTDSEGNLVLICGMEEHAHKEACLASSAADISAETEATESTENGADTAESEAENKIETETGEEEYTKEELEEAPKSAAEPLTEPSEGIIAVLITEDEGPGEFDSAEENAALEELRKEMSFATGRSQPGKTMTIAGPVLESRQMTANLMMAKAISWSETDPDGNGIHLSKYASANEDGTYTITLEQWTTGKIIEERVPVPTDIILVLDQTESLVANTDGGWYRVYYPDPNIEDGRTQFLVYGYWNSSFDGKMCNARYNQTTDSWEAYVPSRTVIDWDNTLYRTGITWLTEGWYDVTEIMHNAYAPNYSYYYGYYKGTYYYDNVARGMWFRQLVDGHGENNLNPLKEATAGFIRSVYSDAVENDVDHRISIIGFSSRENTMNYTGGTYLSVTNNEDYLLGIANSIGVTASETRTDVGLSYANSVLDSNDSTGRNRIVILFTDGGPTSSEITIFDQTSASTLVQTFDTHSNTVANAAIAEAAEIKNKGVTLYTIGIFDGADGTPPADYSDSDAHWLKEIYVTDNILQYSYDNRFFKYNPVMPNRFLHLLSSNYPQAQSMTAPGACSSSSGSYYLSAADGNDIVSAFAGIAEKISTPTVSLDGNTLITDTITEYFEPLDAAGNATSVRTYVADYDGSAFGRRREISGLNTQISGNTVTVSGYDFDSGYITDTPRSDTGDCGRKLIIEFDVRPRDEFIGGNAVPTNSYDGTGISHPEHPEILDFYPEPEVNVTPAELSASASDIYVYLLDDLTEETLISKCSASYTGRWSGNTYPIEFGADGSAELDWEDDFMMLTEKLPVGGRTDLTEDDTYNYSVSAVSRLDPALPSEGAQAAPNRNPGPAAEEKYAETEASIYVFRPSVTFVDRVMHFGYPEPDNADFNAVDYEPEKTVWHNTTLNLEDTKLPELKDRPALKFEYTPDQDCVLNDRIYTLEDVPVSVKTFIGDANVSDYIVYNHHDCGTEGAPVRPDCSWTDKAPAEIPSNGNPAFLIHVDADYILPETGGRGVLIYYIPGVFMIVTTLIMLQSGQRKKRKGVNLKNEIKD